MKDIKEITSFIQMVGDSWIGSIHLPDNYISINADKKEDVAIAMAAVLKKYGY